MIPPVNWTAGGRPLKNGRRRNKAAEMGELGRQCSYNCRAEGDQNQEPARQSSWDPLRERSNPLTGWTATDSDPATAGLKVSVTQEPACKNATDCLHEHKKNLRMIGPYQFSRPTVQRPSTTSDGRCGSDWTYARHLSFFQ